MSRPSLIDLPTELLRRICGLLPCHSALDFILVCRVTHNACDDWTVWRAVLVHSGDFPSVLPDTENHDVWKPYVIASTKALTSYEHWTTKDIEGYLPQLFSLCHSRLMQSNGICLDGLYDSILANAIQISSLSGWQQAQAAAFCTAVRYFGLNSTVEEQKDSLSSIPWPPTPLVESPNWTTQETAAAQHTQANRVVGLFRARLHLIRGTSEPEVDVHRPPSAITIPFLHHMSLPLPLTSGSLASFNSCHLPSMTDPSFFTQDCWTGCFTTGMPSIYSDGFLAVGGPHADAFPEHGMTSPPGYFPHGRSFQSVVRFTKVGNSDERQYQLETNNFHTDKGSLHRLSLTVHKQTGQVSIQYWNAMLVTGHFTYPGVITPFGIVMCLDQPKVWLWLWKVDWSAPA